MHWKKWLLCVETAVMVAGTGCRAPDKSEPEPAVAVWIDDQVVLVDELKECVAVSLKNWGLEDEIGDADIRRAVDTCIRDICAEKVIRREARRLGLKQIDGTVEIPDEFKRSAEGFEFLEQNEVNWWNRVANGFQVMDLAGGISEEFGKDIRITDEMIRQEYETRLDYFTIPEKLELRVIRVYDSDLADDLYNQLVKKWKFETLAKQHSNIKGEGAAGESIVKQIGEIPSEFETELIQLKPGQFSRVMASSEGFFIYKLVSRYPPEILPLESVRDRLQEELAIRLRSQRFQEWLDQQINMLTVRQGTPLAVPGDGS